VTVKLICAFARLKAKRRNNDARQRILFVFMVGEAGRRIPSGLGIGLRVGKAKHGSIRGLL
jgi:hypothetical protein